MLSDLNYALRQLAKNPGFILAGLALAFAVTRYIRRLFYETSSAYPVAIAASIGLLVVAALLATLIPAWRAAKVDPMIALRAE